MVRRLERWEFEFGGHLSVMAWHGGLREGVARVSHFHLASGPANSVANPECRSLCFYFPLLSSESTGLV